MQYPMDTIHHIIDPITVAWVTRPLFRQKIGKTLKEMKRSDASWRFTCGDVHIFYQTTCNWDFSPSGRDAEKFSFWKYILIYILLHFSTFIYIFYQTKCNWDWVLPLGETLKSFLSLFHLFQPGSIVVRSKGFLQGVLFWSVIFPSTRPRVTELRQFWFWFLTTFAPSLPH